MLMLTDDARTAIETILSNTDDPDGSGLRIAASERDSSALAMTMAQAPQDGDTVVQESGARVFLAPAAAAVLEDKVLDTNAMEGGAVQFKIVAQG